jgi:hypothetical protein
MKQQRHWICKLNYDRECIHTKNITARNVLPYQSMHKLSSTTWYICISSAASLCSHRARISVSLRANAYTSVALQSRFVVENTINTPHIRIHTHMHIHIRIHIHTYTCTHTHIFAHTYTYTYSYALKWLTPRRACIWHPHVPPRPAQATLTPLSSHYQATLIPLRSHHKPLINHLQANLMPLPSHSYAITKPLISHS